MTVSKINEEIRSINAHIDILNNKLHEVQTADDIIEIRTQQAENIIMFLQDLRACYEKAEVNIF